MNACPPGTELRDLSRDKAFSRRDCVCKPGYSADANSDGCQMCPAGTYSPDNTGSCQQCPSGTTSREGAQSKHDCRPVPDFCPLGQWAPAGAESVSECRCYKGFGGEQCIRSVDLTCDHGSRLSVQKLAALHLCYKCLAPECAVTSVLKTCHGGCAGDLRNQLPDCMKAHERGVLSSLQPGIATCAAVCTDC